MNTQRIESPTTVYEITGAGNASLTITEPTSKDALHIATEVAGEQIHVSLIVNDRSLFTGTISELESGLEALSALGKREFVDAEALLFYLRGANPLPHSV